MHGVFICCTLMRQSNVRSHCTTFSLPFLKLPIFLSFTMLLLIFLQLTALLLLPLVLRVLPLPLPRPRRARRCKPSPCGRSSSLLRWSRCVFKLWLGLFKLYIIICILFFPQRWVSWPLSFTPPIFETDCFAYHFSHPHAVMYFSPVYLVIRFVAGSSSVWEWIRCRRRPVPCAKGEYSDIQFFVVVTSIFVPCRLLQMCPCSVDVVVSLNSLILRQRVLTSFSPQFPCAWLRYLSRVCARLPPLYSEERAQLRLSLEAKSLEDALEVIEAAEGDMQVE